jgi:hypothetical protein
LRGAQVVQRVIGQQPDDQLGDVLTEGLCTGAAPDRGAHEERDRATWKSHVRSGYADWRLNLMRV